MTPEEQHAKWSWKMDYCRSKEIPAAQAWAWLEAEEAYQEHIKAKQE